jgi:hypothetical protein
MVRRGCRRAIFWSAATRRRLQSADTSAHSKFRLARTLAPPTNRACQFPAKGLSPRHEPEASRGYADRVGLERSRLLRHDSSGCIYRLIMAQESRRHLNRGDIDKKVEEVLFHFDPQAFSRRASPIYAVVDGLKDVYHIPFLFDQDLGRSRRGKRVFKILGRFDFKPRQILIDKSLPHDSPRFRWTLCQIF